MSQARSENGSTPDILGHLESYDKANERYRRFASLKENVEKERQSVQEHIYEKVKREYEEKMLAVEQELEKQRDLLQEKIQDVLDRRAELDRSCRKDTERLEEIDFRTRVGEFTEEECREKRSEIEHRTHNQAQELARLEGIVERCTKSGLLTEGQPAPNGTAALTVPGGSGRPENGRAKEAPDQASPVDDTPGEADSPEADTQTAATTGTEEDFEIVEEGPAADDQGGTIVHCPPHLSAGSPQAQGDAAQATGRPGPNAGPSEYVTGYLVALEGSRQGERFPMISSNITLGNSPGIDIRLSDSGIANFHARILYKERKHFLENLDSMGRSFVNGVQAAEVVELKDGDVIRLGDIKMQVEYASPQTTHAH